MGEGGKNQRNHIKRFFQYWLAFFFKLKWILEGRLGGSVGCPTSAQVMISRFLNSSLMSGSVLTAQGLEPAFNSVSPSLSDPSPFMLCLPPSLKSE